MAAEIFTDDWARAWSDKINANAAYKKAAAKWEGAIAMVECGASEVSEQVVLDALELAAALEKRLGFFQLVEEEFHQIPSASTSRRPRRMMPTTSVLEGQAKEQRANRRWRWGPV